MSGICGVRRGKLQLGHSWSFLVVVVLRSARLLALAWLFVVAPHPLTHPLLRCCSSVTSALCAPLLLSSSPVCLSTVFECPSFVAASLLRSCLVRSRAAAARARLSLLARCMAFELRVTHMCITTHTHVCAPTSASRQQGKLLRYHKPCV